MLESALMLGPERNIVGVLTQPSGTPRRVALLILNAGVVHRIGPHRLSVKLARHAAKNGYAALRFDLSGLGDSRASRTGVPHAEQALADIRAVMDDLGRSRGIEAFALFGICSGAEHTYAAALADERVAAIFMLDGYVYPTLKGRVLDFASRLRGLSVAGVARRVRWLLRRVAPPGASRAEHVPEPPLRPPPRARFAADMQRLVERGAHVTMLFSNNAQYSYARQMRDAFDRYGFMARVACHHVTEMDHVIRPLAAQERLLSLIDEWLDRASSCPSSA